MDVTDHRHPRPFGPHDRAPTAYDVEEVESIVLPAIPIDAPFYVREDRLGVSWKMRKRNQGGGGHVQKTIWERES